MKILIVDDDNKKIERVLGALSEAGVRSEDISTVFTIFDAKRELKTTNFDLMLLDVLVPQRAGDEPKARPTIDLLTELSDRLSLKKPRYILGVTAFEDALTEAGPSFWSRTWTVIKFDFATDEWKRQIQACVRYIQEIDNREPASYKTDLCVVTALLTPEHQAVLRLPWSWQPSEPLDDNTFVSRGTFLSGGKTYTVAAAHCTRMGMVSAALLGAKLVACERPRFLVMPGICAGVEGKTHFGDVVVGDPNWDWQNGKHFVNDGQHGFAVGNDPLPLASFIRARVDQLRSDRESISKIRHGWPDPPATELTLRVGPMASGSSVVADGEILDKIKSQNRALLAVEMEAFGISANGIAAGHPRPTAFALKGVCDFASEVKDDRWQAYAAYTSAEMLRIFFERYMSEISEFAGTR